MRRCSNSHKGCPELARHGAVSYCVDCYSTWQQGGYAAVDARLADLRKPAVKHECIGAAQLAEKDAQIAELVAFKAEVVELHTLRFKGEVRLPEDADLLHRLRSDRVLACAARSAHAHDKVFFTSRDMMSREERTASTAAWLKGLRQRLALREYRQSEMDEQTLVEFQRLTEFRRKITESVSLSMPARHSSTLQDAEVVEVVRSRLRGVRVHPSAINTSPGDKQLDRIESLSKQAAAVSVFWPCFITFAATATFALVAHATW